MTDISKQEIIEFLDYVNDFANYVYDLEISDPYYETAANYIMNIQSKVSDFTAKLKSTEEQ